jgi:hypothetical protein
MEAQAKSRTPNVDGHGSVLRSNWKSFKITLHWHRGTMPWNLAVLFFNMFDQTRK